MCDKILAAAAKRRLAAAGPDLLAALDAMVERADMAYPHFESDEGAEILLAAKMVLRKAKGYPHSPVPLNGVLVG